jgi:hypothetical protein
VFSSFVLFLMAVSLATSFVSLSKAWYDYGLRVQYVGSLIPNFALVKVAVRQAGIGIPYQQSLSHMTEEFVCG